MTVLTLELEDTPGQTDALLRLAEEQNLVIRSPDGKVFLVAAVGEIETDDDFEEEVRRTSQQKALRELLTQRATEPATLSAAEARKRLGLS